MGETIIREIKAWMARRDVNQTMLAEHLGLSQSQLSKRLRGSIVMKVDELESIADFLDVDPVVFLKPSVVPWPDGPEGGPGSRADRDAALRSLADKKRSARGAPRANHRYAAA